MHGELGSQRDGRQWGVVALAALVAVAVVAAAFQRDFGPDGYGLSGKGALIVALGLWPAFVEGWRRASGTSTQPFPFLALIGAIHALFFGAPLVLSDRVVFMSLEPKVAALQGAADAVLLGLVALYAGYALVRGMAPARPLVLGCDGQRGAAVAFVALGVGFAARLALSAESVPAGLGQLAVLASHGVHLGIGLLAVLGARGKIGAWARPLAFFGLLPAHLLMEVSSGSIGYAVRDGAFVLMLLWGTGRRVPLVLLALLGIFAMGLRGAAGEFRVLLHHSPHLLEEGPLERGVQFFEIARSELEREGTGSIVTAAFGRFSQVALLAEVVDKTPLAIPHWAGHTYASLPATFVPRFLWPDKPTKELGQRFGHRYGILHETDTTTSVNLPQLVEHFVNFGLFGVLLGSLAVGAVYGLFARLLLHTNVGDAGLVLAALLASRLLHVESDVSLVFGLTAQLAIVSVPVFWYLSPREEQRAETAPSPVESAA